MLQPFSVTCSSVDHSHSKKRHFLLFKWNFLCFILCLLPLVLLLGSTEKITTSSFAPPSPTDLVILV